jgi:hypothetical protein
MSAAAAMSTDRTTSANNTVTCVYFAVSTETENGRTALVAELGVLPQPSAARPRRTIPPSSRHRLGPGGVSFEAKGFRHRAIGTHQVSVGLVVAARPGQ